MRISDERTWFGPITNGIRRAIVQFLAIPLVIIAGFLVLMTGTFWLDLAQSTWMEPVRSFLRVRIFGDLASTSTLLGQVVSSTITITSITFSILLLAVQQAASSLTSAVYDQFLERRINQIFFGYFVGLALYALIVLSTVAPNFNPMISASFVLFLTILALIFLIVLIYTSISQMRPPIVTSTIQDHARKARKSQMHLVEQTRRTPELDAPICTPVRANHAGFVTRIDLNEIHKALPVMSGQIELVIRAPVGTYVADQDTIAEIRVATGHDFSQLSETVRRAITLDRVRDLDRDPAYAVDQLVNIGWTAYSSSKQIPVTGDAAVFALRDLIGTWGAAAADHDGQHPSIPVVYPDNLVAYAIDSLLDVAISSSEGMQSRSFAKVIHAYAMVFDRLPVVYRQRVSDDVFRILSALGDLVLTEELDAALLFLADVLAVAGWRETAEVVLNARAELAKSIGTLNSRSTRTS